MYKCTHRIDNVELAVKVAAYKNDLEKNVLMREAKICSMLSHQNIGAFSEFLQFMLSYLSAVCECVLNICKTGVGLSVAFIGVFQGANVVHLVFEQVTGGELFDAIVRQSHFSEIEARYSDERDAYSQYYFV